MSGAPRLGGGDRDRDCNRCTWLLLLLHLSDMCDRHPDSMLAGYLQLENTISVKSFSSFHRSVYKAKDRLTNELVAMKKIRMTNEKEGVSRNA